MSRKIATRIGAARSSPSCERSGDTSFRFVLSTTTTCARAATTRLLNSANAVGVLPPWSHEPGGKVAEGTRSQMVNCSRSDRDS